MPISVKDSRPFIVKSHTEGAAAIRHKARGRPSNRRIDPGLREFAVSLVREHFADFGPTLAAEKLEEHHGLKVSRETLRKWMAEDGLWLSRKQRRTFQAQQARACIFDHLKEQLENVLAVDGCV